MLNGFIQKVSDRRSLSRQEAGQAMEALLSDDTDDLHRAAFLVALRTRGETTDELVGFLNVMREKMTRVTCGDDCAVDLCGTGGDGSNSFNLSTAAALVAAAGGVTVAKHGNRAISSHCGSADFLHALGIAIDGGRDSAEAGMKSHRFAFLFAPNYHPAAKAVASVRKALGMRTVFNLLGPMVNPAGVQRQLIGVFHRRWVEPVARTLAATGSRHVLVAHGNGGMDEISAEGDTLVCEAKNGEVVSRVLTPEALGVYRTGRAVIAGGTAEENAHRFRQVAEGVETGLREWIVANAAPAFYLSGHAPTLAAGAHMAREVVLSGQLHEHLSRLCNGKRH